MKIEGSLQEIKDFMKEFKSNDTAFTKQQLAQIREEVSKIKIDGAKVAETARLSLSTMDANL